MAPMAVCRVKQLAQGQVEVNISEELGEDVSHALVARSARAGRQDLSRTQELDSVVSAKIFDDIADGFESAANAVADVTTDIGEGVVSVGLTVGDYVGNAATVVGSSIVEAAETTVDALPSEIKSAAQSLGNAVVSTTHFVADVGEMVADGAVDLAGDALQVAQYAVSQGATLGLSRCKLGDKISSAANALGGEIAKLGDLAVGLAKAAWDEIKKFINCFTQAFSLCNILIGHFCDCERGSSVSISTSGLAMTCSFKTDSDFAKGYGFSAGGESFQMGDDGSSGRVKIPGQTFFQSFKPKGDQLKANQVALNTVKQAAPKGSCETSLALSLEGVVQFAPTLGVSVNLNGDAEVSVEGLARVSLAALATAQGSCAFIAEKRFPKKPLSKVVCGPVGCISIMLQMLAEIELKGVITGSLELAAGADFHIKGKVLVNPRGHADADFETPSIEHQFGMGLAVSSTGSTRVGMGPVLVVFPMPGVPITFNPMMNAEAVDLVMDAALAAAGASTRLDPLFDCPPVSPMVVQVAPEQKHQTTHPSPQASGTCHTVPMGDRFIQLGDWRLGDIDGQHFSVSHKGGYTAQIFRSDGTVHAGPRHDYTSWGRPIGASRGIKFGFQFIQIGEWRLGVYDETHMSLTHQGGQISQIFRADGTLHNGPRTDMHTFDRPECAASGVTLGNQFIQIGLFRLGQVDDTHMSVSHTAGRSHKTIQIYRADGTTHSGPRDDYTLQSRHPVAWTCQSLEEIAHGACNLDFGTFGDRFIQLGEWRLADIDGNHFSISHKDGYTAQIFHAAGTLHPGPRHDFGSWHRPLGYPYGIAFGRGFVQIGRFRLGQVDGTHLSISSQSGQTAQIFNAQGTLHPGPRTDFGLWGRSVGPATRITFGEKFLELGDFRLGDRNFLQIGEWRMGQVDARHFSLSHQGGQTAQIFHGVDGTLHPGPRTDFNIWSWGLEPVNPIQFGDRFIQFGHFRLGDVDGNHLSISSVYGQTMQIWSGHGTLHPGPRTDFSLWHRPSGEPVGVSFGDRFVQLGSFRVGDVDGEHFTVTHVSGSTAAIYRKDGTVHAGPRHDYTTFGRSLAECHVLPP
eukprot:g24947.t1